MSKQGREFGLPGNAILHENLGYPTAPRIVCGWSDDLECSPGYAASESCSIFLLSKTALLEVRLLALPSRISWR